jgi:Fe-S-cluster containining protein
MKMTVDLNRRISSCKRCGTCCRKGGPSLHLEDKPIVEKGQIQTKHLYTLREGELAHDNVNGGIFSVETDIIKIKSQKNTKTCAFFLEKDNRCAIYSHRPVECRVLKCWDTSEIEAIYAKDRLTRKRLIGEVQGLWDLVEAHQKRCDYRKIETLVEALKGDQKQETAEPLIEMIQYDLHIRDLVVEKGGIDSDMLEFLFGRPLFETVKAFGVKVKKDGTNRIIGVIINGHYPEL